jgi:ribosome-binding ATPase YchF (GTP1/OBG family)
VTKAAGGEAEHKGMEVKVGYDPEFERKRLKFEMWRWQEEKNEREAERIRREKREEEERKLKEIELALKKELKKMAQLRQDKLKKAGS